MFVAASPFLSFQSGSKTCQFCDLVIISKEARNNISVRATETLKKPDVVAQKWSNIEPVSSNAKSIG